MKADLTFLIDDLKDERERIIASMTSGQGWTDEHIRGLANIHTAILAVEAQMFEPEPVKTGPKVEFGPDGYPK